MTMEMVVTICTGIVTYILGFIVKEFKIMENKYIPLQNLIIGILAGIISYKIGLGELIPCTIYCLGGSMGAGGAYNMSKIVKPRIDEDENEENEEDEY